MTEKTINDMSFEELLEFVMETEDEEELLLKALNEVFSKDELSH